MAAPSDDDVLRILISTDNHLGVWEKDEIRKDDSFAAFEEVFEVAAANNADLVLLGGDLFHDNKPSRYTIVRAMDILARHCLGDRPVRFQVLSDQAQNFSTGRVNFADPNLNVGLPVLTIHGNHDDPAGAENLSAVDILSTCRLVNYFGKASIEGKGTGKLRIAPVLLSKGSTRLALYGLGNLRDERLCRLFATPNSVEWARPADAPGIPKDDWFNVFVLHQNRVAHTQNAKNCLREGALARFLDVVVWGHEHECIQEPWESAEAAAAFSVMQPGSSVATALSEGESKRKHCVMLEVLGHQWRVVKHPLESVRPFQFSSVVLADQMELDPSDSEGVQAFLERKVTELIEAAERERAARSPALPLVRLRVDYSGFSTINTQRFGQRFVGRVANPNDIVLWQKAPARKAKDAKDAKDQATAAGLAGNGGLVRPEALDEARIEDLIQQHLAHNLEILPEQTLAEALHEFVEKDNKDSIRDTISRVLQEALHSTLTDDKVTQVEQDADLQNIIAEVAAKQREVAAARATQMQRAQETQQQETQQQQQQVQAAAAGGSVANSMRDLQLDADDDMLADGPAPRSTMPPPPARKPAAKAAPAARTRGKPKPAASGAAGSMRQSPLNFQPSATTQRGGSSQRGTQQADNSVGVAAGRGGSRRAAAAKASERVAAQAKDTRRGDEDVEDSDEEAEVVDLADSESEEDAIDSADEELEDEEREMVAQPPSRKRGRPAPAAAPASAAKRRGAAADTQHTGVSSFVVSEDEDEVLPAAGRRRGGAGMLRGESTVGGRSQPFGGVGTGSQVSKGGWGH